MEKALAYARVSTAEQAREGVSLDAQVERIRAYCQMSGLSLVTVIREEGVSAAKLLANRPGRRRRPESDTGVGPSRNRPAPG